MKSFFNFIFALLAVLGCVLGAGFISGAEIYSFFVKFGIFGILGIVVSSLIFGIFIAKSASKTQKNTQKISKINSLYAQKCKNNGKNNNLSNKNITKNAKECNKAIKNNKSVSILQICQLFMCGTMVAGLVETFGSFGGNIAIWRVVVVMLLFVCLMLGIRLAGWVNAMVSVCTILAVPVLYFFAISSGRFSGTNCLENLQNLATILPAQSCWNLLWFMAKSFGFACFYATMNIVASEPVVTESYKQLKSGKKIFAWVSAGVVCVLLLLFFALVAVADSSASMPIASLITNSVVRVCYRTLGVVAMLSTLMSASAGAKQIFDRFLPGILSCLLTAICAGLISLVGFRALVNYCYPAIGAVILLKLLINELHIKNR